MKTKLFFIGMLALIGLRTNAQWVTTNGPLSGGIINTLYANSSNIFCGTQFEGTFIYNGTSWSTANIGLMGSSPTTCITGKGTDLYCINGGIGSEDVYLSTNNGSNWNNANTGLNNEAQTILAYGPYLFTGTDAGGIDAIFLSYNNGNNWSPLLSGSGFVTNGVSAMMIDTTIDSGLVVACVYGGVQITTDRGRIWKYNTFLGGNTANCIARSGSNIFIGTNNGVYLTTDYGNTWTAVNSSMPGNDVVYSLAVDGSNIFAGSDSGVYVTSNNGLLWTAVNTGLTDKGVHSLAIYGTDLYAGTRTQGVWKRSLSQMVSGINEISGKNKINVYPNPFVNSFSIENTKAGSLYSLFDLTGREIGEYKATGNTLNINGDGLQQGIYILKSNDGQAVKLIKE